METAARMILHDFQRGRLPYFVPPPKSETDVNENKTNDEDNKKIDFVPESNSKTESEKNSNEIPNVKQNFDSLTVGPQFEGDDLKIDPENSDNIEDTDVDSEEESDYDDENGEQSDEPELQIQTEGIDDEISFNYFKNHKDTPKINNPSNDHDEILDSSLIETLTSEEKNFLGIQKTSKTSKIF